MKDLSASVKWAADMGVPVFVERLRNSYTDLRKPKGWAIWTTRPLRKSTRKLRMLNSVTVATPCEGCAGANAAVSKIEHYRALNEA